MIEYVIYEQTDTGRIYLTSLPNENNPLSGFGFQSVSDGTIPRAAGTCPTKEDAERVIEYLVQARTSGHREYGLEEVVSE